MNKQQIFILLISLVKENLKMAYAAAQNTYDIATHEDNKAENKYDTRGLEASYLAGAQAERVADIKSTLGSYENLKIREFNNSDKIALTALVEVMLADKKMYLLVMPKGGGQVVHFENKSIQVITPDSPLGKNLIGKEVGEVIQITSKEKPKEYEILNLF